MPKWTNEQSLAINSTGQNIIVSAGAGSGKTAVLSERVLTHVKKGIDINDILVLTFTNAAAAEMKNRIKRKISDFDKAMAEKVEVADITTFDAYSLSLVKKYNHLLNISDKVNIVDAALISIKKRQFLELVFDKYYKEKNKLFLKLIGDFCLKDDREVFEAILKINDSLDNLYDKDAFLNNYVESYYIDKNINKFISEYFSLIKDKIDEIILRIDYLSSYVSYDYIEKLNGDLSLLFVASNYDEVKKSLPLRISNLPKGSVCEAKSIKSEISSIIKELKEFVKYENEAEIKKSIFDTKDYAVIICEIILKLSDMLMQYKLKSNSYEFVDISKMAIKILKTNENIRQELKDKYKEILIDEYQDTNDLQELFVSLICDNNVYMVGDIKQSIYRFRNANPLLFKGKYDNYSEDNGGMKIDLNKNFRSRKDVCDAINLMFNLVMDIDLGGANYLASHQMVYGNKAYESVNNESYEMEILKYSASDNFSKEEIEIFTIAGDIKKKIESGYKIMDKDTFKERKVNYSDFVILMDRSSSFENYKKVFEYLNIPLTIYRDKVISDSVDIMLIRNLYRVIVSIKDKNYDNLFRHAFMSILRSYLYRLPDDEIFEIISNNKYFDTDLYKKCCLILDSFDILDNNDLCLKIIKEFDFYNKMITVGNISEHIVILDFILKIASNLGEMGYGPRKFLDYLDEISERGLDIKLSTNKESSNSVKIMTIHGSKGLEYPICYFSGLYKKFNIDELKNKFYFSLDYGIVMPYIKESACNTILKVLLKNKYKHDEISERLRLFYVALTRAREKIIIVSSFEEGFSFKKDGVIASGIREKYNCFDDVLASICEFVDNYVITVSLDDLDLTKDYNFNKRGTLFDKSIDGDLVVEEFKPSVLEVENYKFSKNINNIVNDEESKNIELGLRMHRIFELIDFQNPDYSGLSDFEKDLVSSFLSLDIIKSAKKFYKEYEFIYEDNDRQLHGIIDLLILGNGEYSIVDYKLNDVTDEDYLKQLEGYKRYIEYVTGKKPSIYLYSILEKKLVQLN